MKKIIFAIICTLILTSGLFAQTWQWAKHFGANSGHNDYLSSFCLDSNSNCYITGFVGVPQAIFGNDTLAIQGYYNDVFITKLDGNGNFIWSERAGGNEGMTSSGEGGSDILYDHNSNSIIFCGDMNAPVDSIDSCIEGYGSTSFLSKLDTSGNCVWVFSTPNGFPGVGGITMDNAGYIYMTGQFLNNVNFGGFPLQAGCFIAKFNSTTGLCVWVKKITDYSNPFGPISYYNNKLYVVGFSVNDTLTVDTATAYCYANDIFISAFDTSGNVQWLKTMGGPYVDRSNSISLDGTGNIYITGYFQDTCYFDSAMLTNGNNRDFFLAKYSNTGNLIWIRQGSITGNSYGPHNVSSDLNGNVYVAGQFSGTGTFGAFSINASSALDLFVARYDSSGTCLGVRNINNYNANGLCIGNNISDGGCYVSGTFMNNTTFDNYSLTSYGGNDIFIAKVDAFTGIGGDHRSINNQLIIYANPNAGKCNITVPDDFQHEKNLMLSIYDNTGKLIQQKTLLMNDGKIKLNLEAEAKGAYNVTLSNGSKSYNGKIVFE